MPRRRLPITPRSVAAVLTGLLLLTGCGAGAGADEVDAPSGSPRLQVTVVADGLTHPWDVAQAPDGTLLVDQRPGELTAVLPGGHPRTVQADFSDLYARGETGLMGLVLDPGFADTRRFYTCQGVTDGEGTRIAVLAWTMAEDWSSATREPAPVLDGIPANTSSGRHGGCRLRFDPQGRLLVGTGDNAQGTNPQDLTTLAGKLLRLDAATGRPSAGNPFLSAADPVTRYVVGYGHRNVQGIAVRPGSGQVFTVEQGTTRDDEVNLAVDGADYGYDPAGPGGGYDESVPMTDLSRPGAVPAVWSSGDPTIATSGGTFLDGPAWGAYDGLMLVGVQKGQGVLALRLGAAGTLVDAFRLPELEGTHGRIRTVQQGVDGALYVTTDNGEDDELLRVTPRS